MSAPRFMRGYNPVAGKWYPPKKAPEPAAYYKYAHQNIIAQRYPELVCTNVKSAEEISYEINNAPDNYAEVKLVADIDLHSDDGKIHVIMIPAGKTLEIDLNGHIVTGPCWMFYNFGSVIVKDSVGTGKIVATTKETRSAIYTSGAQGEGNFTLISGSITTEPVYDGTEPDVEDDDNNYCYGIYALQSGTVNIKGGKIITDMASAISSNNTTGDMYVKISGGELISNTACIYLPSQQDLDIRGDARLIGGICARMGQITIDDNVYIKGSPLDKCDSLSDTIKYKSGVLGRPEAIYIFAGCFTSENESFGNACNVTIGSGVTLKSTDEDDEPVAIYKLDFKYDQKVKVNLKKFGSAYNIYDHDGIAAACEADGIAYDPVVDSEVTVFISGKQVFPLIG